MAYIFQFEIRLDQKKGHVFLSASYLLDEFQTNLDFEYCQMTVACRLFSIMHGIRTVSPSLTVYWGILVLGEAAALALTVAVAS